MISLLPAVELSCHDELHLGMLSNKHRVGFEQKVKALIVADQTEEQQVTGRGVEAQMPARLGTVHRLTEIVVERMGRGDHRHGGSEPMHIVANRLRERGNAIDRADKPAGQQRVARTRLVRDEIVAEGNDAGGAVAACNTPHGTQARRHERHPIGQDEHIGSLLPDAMSQADPREGIDRRQATFDAQVGWCGLLTILGLAREEEAGVLQREGVELHFVTFGLQLMRQALVECRNTSSVWPGWANNGYSHFFYLRDIKGCLGILRDIWGRYLCL